LTAMLAIGGGMGLWLAARRLNNGADPHRVAGFGAVIGVVAFAFVMFAAPLESAEVFGVGVGLIGFGGGLFAHGTLTASMAAARPGDRGLALGAWGAAQATAAGVAIALSGFINDAGSALAVRGAFGDALADPVTGFTLVYALEILLLLATVVAIGPLTRKSHTAAELALGRGSNIGFNPGGLP
jgi:BCD family chlorophyll transporter-like MFS transporter